MRRLITIALILLYSISGCGKAVPAATAVPPDPTNRPPTQTQTAANTPPSETAPARSTLPALATAVTATPQKAVSEKVQVTFVGISGFLITVNDQKVLIDALNELEPEAVKEQMLKAEPPFDDVDLILATHHHSDHVSPSMVSSYLQSHPDTRFISTSQAAAAVEEFLGGSNDQVIAMDPREGQPSEEEANGIKVEAIYLSHGTPPAGQEEIFNNAYIVTMGELTFFHTGDIVNPFDILPYHLAEKGIDMTFFVYFFLEDTLAKNVLLEGIGATDLFPMHYPQRGFSLARDSEKIWQNYPEAILFENALDSWVRP